MATVSRHEVDFIKPGKDRCTAATTASLTPVRITSPPTASLNTVQSLVLLACQDRRQGGCKESAQ